MKIPILNRRQSIETSGNHSSNCFRSVSFNPIQVATLVLQLTDCYNVTYCYKLPHCIGVTNDLLLHCYNVWLITIGYTIVTLMMLYVHMKIY